MCLCRSILNLGQTHQIQVSWIIQQGFYAVILDQQCLVIRLYLITWEIELRFHSQFSSIYNSLPSSVEYGNYGLVLCEFGYSSSFTVDKLRIKFNSKSVVIWYAHSAAVSYTTFVGDSSNLFECKLLCQLSLHFENPTATYRVATLPCGFHQMLVQLPTN